MGRFITDEWRGIRKNYPEDSPDEGCQRNPCPSNDRKKFLKYFQRTSMKYDPQETKSAKATQYENITC